MKFEPSSYQQSIFDWINNGTGNGIINAVAGSGKTTTLIAASQFLRTNRILFSAFNSHTVDELRQKVPNNVSCQTIHAIGRACLISRFPNVKLNVQEYKYKGYCNQRAKHAHTILLTHYENKMAAYNPHGDEDPPSAPPRMEAIQEQLEKLVTLIRCTLTDIDDMHQMLDMIEHFTVDCPVPIEDISYIVKEILETGENAAAETQYIDWTDMLWLAYKWRLQPGTYDWVFIDEAQDLNAAQLSLVKKLGDANSRFLFVGDPCQAIYGFSGADAHSFAKIREEMGALEFPLSICYRCPEKVVELAKAIVPEIEAAPSCIPGEVITINEVDIFPHLRSGDLILSRSTEPLVRTCFALLSRKKNAAIKGKDVRRTLVNIIRSVEASENFSYDKFLEHLETFGTEKAAKLNQKPNNERKLIELQDQVNSIAVCYTSFNCPSLELFIIELEKMFRDENPDITLSTVHKAKGMERDRVFLLYPEKLPLKWSRQKEWQLQQETNLKYVALTRSKKALFLVTSMF